MSSDKLLYFIEQPHGPGEVYTRWQKRASTYFATTGCDCFVYIFDRYGQQTAKIKLPGLCSSFAWDTNGDLLAIISYSSPQLIIWDANNLRQQSIDVALRDPLSCVYWSKTSPILAVASTRGNVSIYNTLTSRRIPVIGKHSKKITCGGWNSESLLALGSEDCTLSISNADGDTLRVVTLTAEPADIQFSEMKGDERIGAENTISVIVGKRTLFLYNLLDPEKPAALGFQSHYGNVVSYSWYGDGYILVAFSEGYLISISTHMREVGQELFQIRNHNNSLNDMAVCVESKMVATCGDNTVKIYDLTDFQKTATTVTVEQEIEVERIGFSEDGQILAVCGRTGSVSMYLIKQPCLVSVCGARVAMLSSLIKVSFYQYGVEKIKQDPFTITCVVEPSVLAVGPKHFACALNHHMWLYDLTRMKTNKDGVSTPLLVFDRAYLLTLQKICLNEMYVAVLFDGKIQLHLIDPKSSSFDRDIKQFPEANRMDAKITDVAITNDFLIYSTDRNSILYFFLEDWQTAFEFHHTTGIKSIFVEPTGTRVAFIDDHNQGFVYYPVHNESVHISKFPTTALGMLWDNNLADKNIFIAYNQSEMFVYVYSKQSIHGSYVKNVFNSPILNDQSPLMLFRGELLVRTASGTLLKYPIYSMDAQDRASGLNEAFDKQLNLLRYQLSWELCKVMQKDDNWEQLAKKALENLEIEWAAQAYAKTKNLAMVYSLTTLRDYEDWRELAGYACMLLGDVAQAENWFLKRGSARSAYVALNMHRDLLNWNDALRLAKQFAPEEIGGICKEYAVQLEFSGNYSEALQYYDRALQNYGDLMESKYLKESQNGVARCCLHCGNYLRGYNLAMESDNVSLQKECADILSAKKQLNEAASLYEKIGNYEQAVSIYIQQRNWVKVGEFFKHIRSPKVYLQYGRAKEQRGECLEAVKAYEIAKDYNAVVRLQLEKLNNPEIAIQIVQQTKSVEGAKMVADFFQKINDYSSAIKFLILSECYDAAFQMGKKHNKLELYGEVLIQSLDTSHTRVDDFRQLAVHFESEKNYLLAGKYYFHARSYTKALSQLVKASKYPNLENEALSLAIDVVASSNSESLENELIEFLLGENDGLPKDPKFLFRLYMARKQYREASKTALVIVNEEQINGNYRHAHEFIFSIYQELRLEKIKIPTEMQNNLMLLHSYTLAKIYVRLGDHVRAARLLSRIVTNLSKFPSHTIAILTSAVIEARKGDLKHLAYKYASVLMTPEHRPKIDKKYLKKIEAIVRKPPKADEPDEKEATSPCVYCDYDLLDGELTCRQCHSVLPFCIATGNHVIAEDMTTCPKCDLIAIRSPYVRILETDQTCPMCSEKVNPQHLRKLDKDELANYLKDLC